MGYSQLVTAMTVMEQLTTAVTPSESVAVTLNVETPTVVRRPLATPVAASSVSPAGRAPEVMAKV